MLSSGAAAPRAQPCMSWDGAGTPGCCSSRVGAVCQAWLPGQEAGAGPVWEGEREEGSAASGLCSGLRHS